ncbi:uncharacterized protein LOC122503928 [Leptopilina heterotoma]|uniref:uncharacterized protein LOC122503928 n=1 Tax=Leptopilina heterotoma TaxID=63436 RepID=UPI001CA93BEC|nr:uncharacterized protein LOC122503928 [Leptopilina heterotoma]
MSKLVILFCTFLLAGTVYSQITDEDIEKYVFKRSITENLANTVVGKVSVAIKKINDYFEVVETVMSKSTESVQDEATKIANLFADDLTKVQQTLNAEFDLAKNDENYGDVSECVKHSAAFNESIEQAKLEISQCTSEVVNDTDKYLLEVKESSDGIQEYLLRINEKVEKCASNINGFFSGAKALWCARKASLKKTWTATKKLPAFLVDLGELMWKVATSMTDLAECKISDRVEKAISDSQIIGNKIRECIRGKLK